jgi:transcriptional regulator with XRE-family HTH domain
MTIQGVNRRTVDEWEQHVGIQVRDLRRRAGLTQQELAGRANVSTGAVQNLEYGAGSRLATLVQVVRALGRSSWLDELAPPVTTSPMQLLAERQASGPRADLGIQTRRDAPARHALAADTVALDAGRSEDGDTS